MLVRPEPAEGLCIIETTRMSPGPSEPDERGSIESRTTHVTKRGLRHQPVAVLSALGVGGLLLVVAAPAAADQTIQVRGLEYWPSVTHVEVGETVIWENARDNTVHTATADDGSFDTGIIAAGTRASIVVEAEGTIPYHCEIVPSMTGTLIVAAADGSPTASPEPTDEASATPAATTPGASPEPTRRSQPPTDTVLLPARPASGSGATVLALIVLAAAAGVLLRMAAKWQALSLVTAAPMIERRAAAGRRPHAGPVTSGTDDRMRAEAELAGAREPTGTKPTGTELPPAVRRPPGRERGWTGTQVPALMASVALVAVAAALLLRRRPR